MKIYQFKVEISEIKNHALCLGNVLKDFTINIMKKKTVLRVVNFFLLILIRKYLMERT